MAKTKRKWIQLDPNHPDALLAQHIYVDANNTIADKLTTLEGAKFQASVSSNDTAPGYLQDKIIAGTNVIIDVINEGANEQIRISASGGGGAGGDLVRDIDTYQMTPDDTLTGVDVGKAFAMIDTVDFSPSLDGAVWFTTAPKSNWDLTLSVNLYLYVIFAGTIAADQVCRLRINVYETPVGGTPVQLVTDSIHDITVPATDTGKLTQLSLDSFLIGNSQSLLTVQVARLASDATDTFEGTMQLLRAKLVGQTA